jgi:hypothetical protein
VSSDDAARSVATIASRMGAHLGRSPRGNVVVNLQEPFTKLDDNCIYPIVNDRTGVRMGTYAGVARAYLAEGPERVGFTGMVDLNSKHRVEPSGNVLLELSFQALDAGHTRLEFWSNCIADTALDVRRRPANSTGKFERAFLAQLAPGLNLDIWTAAASATSDAAAEIDYRARSEFDLNDIHRSVLRHLHPGVPERTRVKAETAASLEDVWRAAQRATRRFAELRGLTVSRTDERFHLIQNGDASVGVGDRAWREDLTTTLADSGSGRTRITVVRRLLVPSPDGSTWNGYSSDGEMESWLVGAIMKELATPSIEPNEKRIAEALPAPSPIAARTPSVNVSSVPAPTPVSTDETPVSTATVEVAISSSVENADVYVDGHFVGNAPMPNYRLTTGIHTIEVRATGYETWSREMTVAVNAATRISAQLRRLP